MRLLERELEVPYNFDKDLITGLSIIDKAGEHIHCIYSAPYRPDYRSAKYDYTHASCGKDIKTSQTMSREEYESHITYINEKFPKKLMLLLQQTKEDEDTLMQKEMLQYYIKLGFYKFCVGSIAQAKLIKSICPFAEITASIAMKLEPKDMGNPELRKYFSNVVLWFPYNRDIEKIESLPNYFKYILLVNCTCSIYCDGTHHWFADRATEYTNSCPNSTHGTLWSMIWVRPTDIPLFANKISYLKLQGREYVTSEIIEDFILFTSNKLVGISGTPVDRDLYTKKTEEERAKLIMDVKRGNINYYRDYIEYPKNYLEIKTNVEEN